MAFVNDITYKYGLQAKYDALLQRDEQTLYWCTDTAKLYKGDVDYTEAVRFVDKHDTLLTPARKVKIIKILMILRIGTHLIVIIILKKKNCIN